MQGSDRGRIRKLWLKLKDPRHPAWLLIDDRELREDGYHALADLVELLLGADEASK